MSSPTGNREHQNIGRITADHFGDAGSGEQDRGYLAQNNIAGIARKFEAFDRCDRAQRRACIAKDVQLRETLRRERDIGNRTKFDRVDANSAVKPVAGQRYAILDENIVAIPARHRVAAETTEDRIVTFEPGDDVVSSCADQNVSVGGSHDVGHVQVSGSNPVVELAMRQPKATVMI
jgi:hypothetical protein